MQQSRIRMMRRGVVPLLLLLFSFLPGCATLKSSHNDVSRPNFIVIFCDNLGYGDIEPFGSTVHRTPQLNRMADEGLKFTHFYVPAGVCTPSRAALMTGCYPQRVGMHTNPRDGMVLRPLSPYGLHPDEVTIAEVLKEQGYATGIIGKWHLGDQPDFMPRQQGFDYFFGIPYSDDMTQDVGKRLGDRFDGTKWPPLPLLENEILIEAPADRNRLTERYTQKALEFIGKHKDDPFFLYLPQAMPGSTRTPFAGKAFRGKSANGPWGDAVEELDWSTGEILDALVAHGIDRRTLVIFTSDNGAPMERDWTSVRRGTNQPLYGRGYTTAEGGFRVPTIFWWPGQVSAGGTSAELATSMDILPTFAQLACAQAPQDRIIDGKDIRSLIFKEEGSCSPHEVLYYYNADQLQAIRSGPWKLFLPLEQFTQHPHFSKGKSADPLLFNLVEDPGSKNNVATAHPEVVQRLINYANEARLRLGDGTTPGREQRPPGYQRYWKD